ncbi:CUB and sushi domain-containing protein 3-like [Branchiostoma floridae x Branchiostoma japonicum]
MATYTCNSGYNLVGGPSRTCQTDLTWSGSSPTCAAVQCPALTAPTNGGVSGGNTYQDVATFTCDPGYNLAGSPTLTCQADTTWSAASPTCTAGLCPTLTPPTNGAVSGSNSLGNMATYTCNSGYNLVGGPSRTCQTDLTWSGSSPTCAAVQCPALTAPTNGGVSGGNTYEDVATFTCDPGYNLAGSPTLTCQADTTWSAASPTCTIGQCPALTAPTNGAVTGSNSFGDTITFTCDPGYIMAGSSTLACQSDLTWDGSPPTCSAGQCPAPASPTNGAVTGPNSLGDTITYTCDTGYNMAGSSTLTCQTDLTWDGSPPTCTAVQCPALTAPTNGGVSGGNTYEDVATFTCDPGYNLAGSSTLTCQADTTWSAASPTCTSKCLEDTCPAPTSPTNGAVTGTYLFGDTITFTCNTGYNMAGSSTLTCQSDLTWDGSPPTCTIVQCSPQSSPPNGAVSGGNSYGDVATFTCNMGYNMVGTSTLTCQADGTWSGAAPTCAIVQCPVQAPPDNGGMTGSNSYQDIVQFTCNSGYEMTGAASITCQADGTWSDSAPTCGAVECPLLTAPANGAMTGSNFYQDVAQFTCNSGYNLAGTVECPVLTAPVNGAMSGSNFYQDMLLFSCIPGYELEGSSTLACQVDATWSGSVPTCKRVKCPILSAPANGAKEGTNSYQDVVEFTCYIGYDLIGSSASTCQADRTWTATVPTCSRVQCPLLTAPTNGAMTGSNFFQDIARFTCNSGYDRVGSSSLTCQADRTWDGIAPTCTRVQCPSLTAPENGAMTGNNFYQDVLLFTCDTGYEMVGTASLTCQADRMWTGTAPTCRRVQCPLLTAAANGEMTGFNFYQDVVEFTCDSGYEMIGSVSLTCQADRTWTGIEPTCIRIWCPMLPTPVNGGFSGTNLYMDTVLFTCDTGYDLIGDSSSTCQADRSWSSNFPSCSEIDECLAANGGCDHACTNTAGSFYCSCVADYNLNADGFTCDDINECNLGNGGCQQNCHNLIGSFQCSCNIGYDLNDNGLACDDNDECFTANGGCDQTCTNNMGSFACSCGTGYNLNANGFFCDGTQV